MKNVFNVTAWLNEQVGRSLADVRADAKLKAVDTKTAVIESQRGGVVKRGRVSLQSRAVVSQASNADSRIRAFLLFTNTFDKRPKGVMPVDWAVYKALTVSWVEQGDVKPEVLDLFGG